nr:hypothetical protein [Tanacetum cinerariifolium]
MKEKGQSCHFVQVVTAEDHHCNNHISVDGPGLAMSVANITQGLKVSNPKSFGLPLHFKRKSIRLNYNSPFKPRWGNDPGKLFATPNLLIRVKRCQSNFGAAVGEARSRLFVFKPLIFRDPSLTRRNVEDKILASKPSKNCTRCTRCGYLVDGPNCQGCALLRPELEEYLVTHALDFQNTFEPSNAITNVVNAPREPDVVKQDHGSFVDKIIFDLNRAPDSPHLHTISPNQFCCFHCKDVLRDGEACKRCTCTKCGSGLVTLNEPVLSTEEPDNSL